MLEPRLYSDLREAVPDILALAVRPTDAKLIRIDGVMGVGKSSLADLLRPELSAQIVRGDDYGSPSEGPYTSRIQLRDFQADLARALAGTEWVIVEAICLEELAPETRFGRGLRVYVKRVSVLGPCLTLWPGFDEGGPLRRTTSDARSMTIMSASGLMRRPTSSSPCQVTVVRDASRLKPLIAHLRAAPRTATPPTHRTARTSQSRNRPRL
jgi:hypothetical protein